MKITFNLLFLALTSLSIHAQQIQDNQVVSHQINPKEGNLHFYWKNPTGETYGSLGNLQKQLKTEGETLRFAMNGGMYLKDRSPQGLYIQNGETLSEINTVPSAYGNFYLQPNGIFYLTKNKEAVVCKTTDFSLSREVDFATQSGPLLVIDGKIHPKFTQGSKNVHIRNGVGILPNGNVLFAMSKNTINLYDFATYFKERGCSYALYLDGFVSRTYLPSAEWEQLDGNFGVIIGEIAP